MYEIEKTFIFLPAWKKRINIQRFAFDVILLSKKSPFEVIICLRLSLYVVNKNS